MSGEFAPIGERLKPILMMGNKIADYLDITALSQGLSEDEIKLFAQHFKVYKVQADDFLFLEGDPERYMGVLISGKLKVLKQDSEGNTQKISEISMGKTVGEMSLVDGGERSASIYAEQDSTVMILYEGRFNEILLEHPQLGVKLLLYLSGLMSDRLRAASDTVALSMARVEEC